MDWLLGYNAEWNKSEIEINILWLPLYVESNNNKKNPNEQNKQNKNKLIDAENRLGGDQRERR